MLPELEVCEQARLTRDPRFDGRFFVAVLSTGIYCRPVCPARTPSREHVRFFASAAAAEQAGYRPCLRCRPERAPEPTHADALASRALARIDAGALDDGRLGDLAAELGVSARHLGRIVTEHAGTTPGALARSRRLHAAKRLIDDTELPFSDVAAMAGYRSLRRFNEAVRQCWQRTPSELRRLRRRIGGVRELRDDRPLTLKLPVTEPYDGAFTLGFLGRRVIAGLEQADRSSYRRLVCGPRGAAEVHVDLERPLRVTLGGAVLPPLATIVARVRRMFDVDARVDCIAAHLRRDPLLAEPLRRWPGVRIPGGWTPFEVGVRAILGQQVSVAAATTLARRLVHAFGAEVEGGRYVFPEPEMLAGADIAGAVGIPAARGQAIGRFAERVASGAIDFGAPLEDVRAALLATPGIGPWTVEYIAMRALGDPDAFPDGDLIVRRGMGLGPGGPRDAVLRRADPWRPWRAYAVMYLWRGNLEASRG